MLQPTTYCVSQQIVEARCFRVMCRRADGTIGLVRLCQSPADARRTAKSAVDKHLQFLRSNRLEVLMDSGRPREVYVERWIGTLVEGHWEIMERDAGGYFFEFFDAPPRSGRQNGQHVGGHVDGKLAHQDEDKTPAVGKPCTGDVVECILLDKRTRKNGWFAKLVDLPASGLVTGPAPTNVSLQAGLTVRLRLCGLKLETGFAQLAWHSEPRSK